MQKDKRGLHAGGLHPKREKLSEAPFFPSFCPHRNCLAAKKFRLCGRRFISLRKAILFFPQKNNRRDREMLHTNSFSTRFLTVRLLFAAVRPVIETRKRKKAFLSDRKFRAWMTIRQGCCSKSPLNLYTFGRTVRAHRSGAPFGRTVRADLKSAQTKYKDFQSGKYFFRYVNRQLIFPLQYTNRNL